MPSLHLFSDGKNSRSHRRNTVLFLSWLLLNVAQHNGFSQFCVLLSAKHKTPDRFWFARTVTAISEYVYIFLLKTWIINGDSESSLFLLWLTFLTEAIDCFLRALGLADGGILSAQVNGKVGRIFKVTDTVCLWDLWDIYGRLFEFAKCCLHKKKWCQKGKYFICLKFWLVWKTCRWQFERCHQKLGSSRLYFDTCLRPRTFNIYGTWPLTVNDHWFSTSCLWANTDCLRSQEHVKLQIQYGTCSRWGFHLHGDSHHCSSPIGYLEFVTECRGYQDFTTLQQSDQSLYHPKEQSVQFSHSVVSDSFRPHGLQQVRLPCPSPTPGACSNSCPSSQWCHLATSSSIIPFSSRLWSFPAPGSFPMSQFFSSGAKV